ncbi:hypothetical protein [Niabella sp.]|uniref:hypothetical protein n=1 Tax=Niabella sp. TaxID=1962976 RepID=UPI00260C1744|nr:hypothetical protein [Niabella sp.]
MQATNTIMPLTISEQARLLGISASQVRRIYGGAPNIPMAAIEKTVQLQQLWAALEQDRAVTAHPDPEAQKTEIADQLRKLQEHIDGKRLRLRFQVFHIERRTGNLPQKMALILHLATAGPEGLINKKELELIQWNLSEKISSAGCYRQKAIETELAILDGIERLIQEQLQKL